MDIAKPNNKMRKPASDERPDVEAHEGSESSHGSGQGSALTGGQQSSQEGRLFTKTESRLVKQLRISVSVVMVLMAIGFGTAVYINTRRGEKEDFEAQ